MNTVQLLVVYEPVNAVLLGESVGQPRLVFPHPALKIVGHADVYSLGPAGEDVRVVRHARWPSNEILRFAQNDSAPAGDDRDVVTEAKIHQVASGRRL